MHSNEEREAFEREYAEAGWSVRRDNDGYYSDPALSIAWAAWQARANLPAQEGEPWDLDVVAEIGCVDVEYVKKHPLYAALGLMGIHPAEWHEGGKPVYTERTDYMNGWNSAVMTITRNLNEIERAIASATPQPAAGFTQEVVDRVARAVDSAINFIENGIELGYVQMPSFVADAAHDTLPYLRDAKAILSTANATKISQLEPPFINAIPAPDTRQIEQQPTDDDKWEDVHLRVYKDDQYNGPGHKCISYKGVVYYPDTRHQRACEVLRPLAVGSIVLADMIGNVGLKEHNESELAKADAILEGGEHE